MSVEAATPTLEGYTTTNSPLTIIVMVTSMTALLTAKSMCGQVVGSILCCSEVIVCSMASYFDVFVYDFFVDFK